MNQRYLFECKSLIRITKKQMLSMLADNFARFKMVHFREVNRNGYWCYSVVYDIPTYLLNAH